ncbi:hypothetical protein ACFP47_00520 [Nesterenkonia lacusekhoensis]|uniref:MinD-like ATPase involved in chromosome partitioning or flagellar assembly n=1 Tax=Nesterenkonia lacusekhoensis TaxID=150832 RepID=A0ABS4T3L6_9MICC|nr:MinD-like ATPase involved in chromosome partitioning or flagellar assembly [Nesterenkonia lacusekhoensis]
MSVAERTVRFTADGVLTLDGQTVQMPEGVTDPYEYCLNILIHQAHGSGTPVSVQAIDDPSGESTFFTVMPNGEVRTHQQPAHNQQAQQQSQHQQTQRPAQHSTAPQPSAQQPSSARAPQEPAHDADRQPSAPPAPPPFEPAQPEADQRSADQHPAEQDGAEQHAAEQDEPQVVEHASAAADSEEQFSAEAALPTSSDQPAEAEDAAEPEATEAAQSADQVSSETPAQQPAEQEASAPSPSPARAADTEQTFAAGHTPEADQSSASEQTSAAEQSRAEHQDSPADPAPAEAAGPTASAETPLPEDLQHTQPQEDRGEQAPAAPSPAEPAAAAEQDPTTQFTDQVTQQTGQTAPAPAAPQGEDLPEPQTQQEPFSSEPHAQQDPHRAAEPQPAASGPDLETSPTPGAPAPAQEQHTPELHNPARESTYPTPAQNLPPADFTFPTAEEPLPVQPMAGPPLDAYGQEPELDMEPSRRERRLRAEQENFLEQEREPSPGTWAKTVEVLTLGLNKAGPSAEEREQQARAQRIRHRLTGSHNTAVLSLKGGIGKTSTTVGVGHALAEHRGDMVCAVDANPDSGDLVERALGEAELHNRTGLTISDVVNDADQINSLTGLQNYLEISDRLYVLAGEQDPELSDSLTAQEYRRVQDLLSQYFAVTLTDCGTGVSHPAMEAVLERADNIVIAAGYAISGAERARRVLTWLDDQGYSHLADEAIIVITDKDTVSDRVIPEKINEILAGLCRGLYVVPHDPAVADGDSVRVDQLKPATLKAYREIAAAIVDGYPSRDGERHGA